MDSTEAWVNSTIRCINFDEHLILQVQANPVLWDASRKGYRDTTLRKAVWRTIAVDLSKSDEECSGRWKLLREKYGRELKKKKKQGDELGEEIEPSAFLDTMSFLRQHIRPRRRIARTSKRARPARFAQEEEDASSLSFDGFEETSGCSPPIIAVKTAPALEQDFDAASSEFAYSDVSPCSASAKKRSHSWTDDATENRLCDEICGLNKALESFACTVGRYIVKTRAPPAKQRQRIDAFCALIADRYMALPSDLQDEFDISAINILRELKYKDAN